LGDDHGKRVSAAGGQRWSVERAVSQLSWRRLGGPDS
jgi:hypothetical protein